MKILIACEESQTVTKAFREHGFEAFSNDIIDCSGDLPEFHLKMDALKAARLQNWDCIIGFPPCTYLTVAANRHIPNNPERWQKQVDALKFVYELMNLPVDHIAIENPVGVISSYIRKPDQIIHPYYFGDPVPKKTCLWLKNLPPLKFSMEDNLFESKTAVEPEYVEYNSTKTKSGKSRYSAYIGTKPSTRNPENAKLRSKTFEGVAQAMALQWGNYLMKTKRSSCS